MLWADPPDPSSFREIWIEIEGFEMLLKTIFVSGIFRKQLILSKWD